MKIILVKQLFFDMTLTSAIVPARILYGIALIAFGSLHFLFGDFITGRAPAWPADLSGQIFFAYFSGAIFILTGLSIIANIKPATMLMASGMTILLWAGVRNIYEIMIKPEYGGLLTNTFKALSIGSGAFIVAASFVKQKDSSFSNLIFQLATIGKYLVALFLLIGGVQHFIFADFVKFLIPEWIPGAIFWTYLAGVALIAAGISLIINIKSSLASLLAGSMIMIWVFVLHLPRAVTNQNQNEWTAVFEALAVSSILLVLFFSLDKKKQKKLDAPLNITINGNRN
jgi:uncharacterized membrane protein